MGCESGILPLHFPGQMEKSGFFAALHPFNGNVMFKTIKQEKHDLRASQGAVVGPLETYKTNGNLAHHRGSHPYADGVPFLRILPSEPQPVEPGRRAGDPIRQRGVKECGHQCPRAAD